MKEDTSTDLTGKMLKDVIDIESHPPEFSCLQSTLHLRKYLEIFYVLTVEHRSDLFLKFWQETIEKKRHGRHLVALIEEVWQSTVLQCEFFLSSLRNGTMKTTVVEERFRGKGDVSIQEEITELFHGLNKCIKRNDSDSWIEKVVKRILIHRSLQQYSETAKSFLLLKECLNLTGVFREVELLSNEVSKIIFFTNWLMYAFCRYAKHRSQTRSNISTTILPSLCVKYACICVFCELLHVHYFMSTLLLSLGSLLPSFKTIISSLLCPIFKFGTRYNQPFYTKVTLFYRCHKLQRRNA